MACDSYGRIFVDSFDDFEFKPLTEGLGFHKKNSQNTLNDKQLPPLEPRSKNSILDNLRETLNTNALSFDTPKFNDPTSEETLSPTRNNYEFPDLAPEVNIFSKPLPRTEQDVKETLIPKFNPRFNKPLVNPSIQDTKIQNTGLLGVLGQKTEIKPNKVNPTFEIKFTEVAPAALSLFLDFTVILGIAILFMLGLVIATNLNMTLILSHLGDDRGVQAGIVLLIYSVSQLYLILSRAFYGQTLGEWSMDTQLGLVAEQENLTYILKLTARTLLLAVTGFVTLPLISMFFEKDYSGRITGLKLYRNH
jgi:hypothetical protein